MTVGRGRSGYTLLEIMVVVFIVGLLVTVVAPRILGRTDDARTTKVAADMASIRQALDLYRLDNGVYPTTEQGLQALVAKPTVGVIPANWRPYLDKLPSDPWGHPYQYANPGLKGEIDVYSFGADGVVGGEKTNADIGSWQ